DTPSDFLENHETSDPRGSHDQDAIAALRASVRPPGTRGHAANEQCTDGPRPPSASARVYLSPACRPATRPCHQALAPSCRRSSANRTSLSPFLAGKPIKPVIGLKASSLTQALNGRPPAAASCRASPRMKTVRRVLRLVTLLHHLFRSEFLHL